jgi:Cytochrome C'
VKLPPGLRFPQMGFWVFHGLVVPSVFGAGIALGIFHATGHGAAEASVHHTAAPADPHADHARTPSAPTAPPDGPEGALRREMIALQAAYDLAGRAIVLGDTSGVVPAFHAVHLLKEETAAAIASGAARPSKNADRIADFVARDEAFHAQLEVVVSAAARGDVAALQAATDALRPACVGCHTEFRAGP